MNPTLRILLAMSAALIVHIGGLYLSLYLHHLAFPNLEISKEYKAFCYVVMSLAGLYIGYRIGRGPKKKKTK